MNFSETFREEAADLLGQLETALLELEVEPSNAEIIDRVFRQLHTIKGSGSMFGFDEIASFTHEVESSYELVRQGKLSVTPHLISLTLKARDHISCLLKDEADEETRRTADRIIADLREFQKQVEQPKTQAKAAAEKSGEEETYRIRFKPPSNVFLRAVNLVGLFRELDAIGQCSVCCSTDNLPALDDFRVDCCYLFWHLVVTTRHSKQELLEVFQFVEDGVELEIAPLGRPNEELKGRRLGEILQDRGDATAEDVERAVKQQKPIGELLVDAGVVSADQVQAALAEQEHVATVGRAAAKPEASSLRVSAEKLDDLVNVVGEIVTMQARLTQLASVCGDPEVTFVAEELERLTDKLRDYTMSIRMLPIGATFGIYRRLVRDLARKLDKQVELVTEGAETELDKTVIDRINDPIVHLIRNCVDHGIETPEDREAAGKPASGRIVLSASHSGAHVIIQVRDDGAGLNKDAIRRKALANGLIRAEQELTEAEIFSLILKPGFSTAASLSGVSGRGVGMDVVKQNVESLSGTLEISSKPGHGSTFTLKLPLTLAIIDGLLVKVADQYFVMPLANILECFELSAEEIRNNHDRCFVEVRGEMVPYVDIRDYFALSQQKPALSQVMIADTREGKFGFLVDNVIGDHKTVIKRLGGLYKHVESVSGATILGDGTVALILDLHKLAKGAVEEYAERLMVSG